MPSDSKSITPEVVASMQCELDATKGDVRELVQKRLKDEGVVDLVTTGLTTRRSWRARERMFTDQPLDASLESCSAPPNASGERDRAGTRASVATGLTSPQGYVASRVAMPIAGSGLRCARRLTLPGCATT